MATTNKIKGSFKTTSINNSTAAVVFTAGPRGTKIFTIIALFSNSNTLTLSLSDKINDNTFFSKTSFVTNEDIMALTKFPKDNNGNTYFLLEPGKSIKASMSNGSTSLFIYGEDF